MCYGTCRYQLWDGECGESYHKPKDGDCRKYENEQSTEDYDLDIEDYEEAIDGGNNGTKIWSLWKSMDNGK